MSLLACPATGKAPPGWLHAIEPRVRVGVAIMFALLVVTLRHPAPAAVALAGALCAAAAVRLAPRPALRALLALDGFMALALASLPFTVPGEPALSVMGWGVSVEGLGQAGLILLKANAVTLLMLALVGTLDPVELGHALSGLGVPARFVHLFLFTVRYLDVLDREYRRLRTAMKARAFQWRFDLHTWISVGYLFGMLLVRGLERADRIAAAMRCRGFNGSLPAPEPRTAGFSDHLFASAAVIALAALTTLDLL